MRWLVIPNNRENAVFVQLVQLQNCLYHTDNNSTGKNCLTRYSDIELECCKWVVPVSIHFCMYSPSRDLLEHLRVHFYNFCVVLILCWLRVFHWIFTTHIMTSCITIIGRLNLPKKWVSPVSSNWLTFHAQTKST